MSDMFEKIEAIVNEATKKIIGSVELEITVTLTVATGAYVEIWVDEENMLHVFSDGTKATVTFK